MTDLRFTAWGRPIGQGNHRASPGGFVYETTKGHAPWRKELVRAARAAMAELDEPWTPIDEACDVFAWCYSPRPQGHYGTGRNALVLKASAPVYPITHGAGKTATYDVDKLTRAINDGLSQGGVIADDARVVDLIIRKRYAEQPTGARAVILVRPHQEANPL